MFRLQALRRRYPEYITPAMANAWGSDIASGRQLSTNVLRDFQLRDPAVRAQMEGLGSSGSRSGFGGGMTGSVGGSSGATPDQHAVVKELTTNTFNATLGTLPPGSRRRLCADFQIASYPTIAYGSPEQFLARANVTIHPSSENRDASSVVAWVGRLMGKPFEYGKMPATKPVLKGQQWLDSRGSQQLQGSQGKPLEPQPNSLWTLADVELATVELFRQIMSTPPLHTGPEKRSALFQLLRWWSAAHPSGRCRGGAQKLVALFDAKWLPASEGAAPKQLQTFEICGPSDQLAGNSWQSCKGSLPNTRGFTCGLWLLFHTSSTRLPDNGGNIFVEGVRAFGNHFFMCGVCQEHFTQIIASPGPLDAVHTREDSMLWAWRTHNQVNARLAAFESEAGSTSGADPMFPKIQFPDARMCPSCWKHATQGDASTSTAGGAGAEWDEGAVLVFLDSVYGDDGSQDDGLDDGQADQVHAHKEGSPDTSTGMQPQVELGRRGGGGFGGSSGRQRGENSGVGNQKGGGAGEEQGGGTARFQELNGVNKGEGSNRGGLEDRDLGERKEGSSSSNNSNLAGDLGSGWVVLVWVGCVLGVVLLACYLLVPQRKGRGFQGFGASHYTQLLGNDSGGGPAGGGGSGSKRSEALTHGMCGVSIGSNGNGSARMRNGNGVCMGAARTQTLPKHTV
ncbi:hypothetical protein DUNSADRAFT_11229 [Dunaliella salina]|uniref:Sulfhydryl oxidase n=1 Tax=Dunaliella salina TaxID=3046 RepID=A0ABQ7GDS9_DUNSA|nr:hypothetical protein DUNSADRAFT_11229 [Dunaliella salina]|eukprot:KAF5832771.1 hypothetical protein DUNSADRAFT_11229 [Dunaliella salina]